MEKLQRDDTFPVNEEILRVLWAACDDAILVLAADNTIRYASVGVRRVFGYEPKELIGQSLAILQPDRLHEPHRHAVEHYVAAGKVSAHPKPDGKMIAVHRDGREFPIECTFGSVVIGGERLLAGFLRDATNRKRLEMSITAARQISMAIGIIMERNRITRDEADELLHARARSQRRKIAEVAAELLNATELMILRL